MNERIVLGSGKLYCTEYSASTGIPANVEIETEANLLGYIQGGATLDYTPTFYDTEDDLGKVKKKMLTKEEASLKSGVMTWNGRTLAKLCSTARIKEDATSKKRTVKIGGVGNYSDDMYVLRFVHEDNIDGDVRVTIVGSNHAGFSLAFTKDKETVIDAEFKAFPKLDSEGTLIIYEEEDTNIENDSFCATPTASEESGAVVSGTSVTLSCSTPGAEIYYTIDGSKPTTSSNKYTTGISITAATTIKAIAVADGLDNSDVVSFAYTISE